MSKTVDTRICEVTVYRDQALVTRRGVVQLIGEEHELVVTQLPGTIVCESVRVFSKGTTEVQLLGVRTEQTYATEAIAEKVTQLTQEIGKIEEQKRHEQDQLALLNLQRNFVKSLSTQYLERLTKLPSPDALDLEQIKELLNFVGEQYSEFSNAIANTDKKHKQLDKEIQLLRQQLQQVSTPSSQDAFNVIVTIPPSTTGEVELEVSYLVPQASWIPLYDLRLCTVSKTLNITYWAEVEQSSREDWIDVTLTLSTANPKLGALPPKLLPWYIDGQQKNYSGQKTKAAIEFDNLQSRILSTTLPFPGMTPAPEVAMEADLDRLKAQAAAEVFKQSGITFKASGSSKILSNGTPQKILIFNQNYACRLQHITMPQYVSLAYLQATMKNPLSRFTLLSGKVNIFRDNTFVGTTELENIAPGQEFKLNCGSDTALKIERDLVERQVDKQLSDNQWRTTCAYHIVITNLREQGMELTVIEQLPVSRHEQISVCLTCCEPHIQISDMGILEWSLSLRPLSSQELYYQFTVEHPPELTVTGLNI